MAPPWTKRSRPRGRLSAGDGACNDDRHRIMLIHDFAYADAPCELVGARVLSGGEARLSPLAAAAVAEGERMRVRLGDGRAEPYVGMGVAVAVGETYTRDVVTVVPMTWSADGAEGAIPMLRGQL